MDRIVCKMHERDLWTGADGKKHSRKRPKGFNAFLDCLELHKLMVFSIDTDER